MKRSKKLAILAALTMGVQFGSHASASDTDYAYYNGVKFAEFEYFNEGEFASEYTLSDFLRNATKSATSYWSEMLGPRSKAPSAWQIIVCDKKISKCRCEDHLIYGKERKKRQLCCADDTGRQAA